MNRFLVDFPTQIKFHEFCHGHRQIGVTIKHLDSQHWTAVVQYEEKNENAVGAMKRMLEGFGEVLRCQ